MPRLPDRRPENGLGSWQARCLQRIAPQAGPHRRRGLLHRGGGYHIGHQEDPAESIRIIPPSDRRRDHLPRQLLGLQRRESEIRMGKALRDGYRAKAFLMTKIDGRDAGTAASQIDESLRRLRTDHVDLLQLHEVIREDDPDRASPPAARSKPWSPPGRPARRASSASPATSRRGSISRCSMPPRQRLFISTPSRCHST